MYFYVTLNLNCGQHCKYCYGKCIDEIGEPFPFQVDDSLPTRITYSIRELADFLAKDPAPVVIFYGGEPTLELPTMYSIMDNVKAKGFIMQTNGLFLNDMEPHYLERLQTIFVSLDGNEELTDYYRGKGNYRRVIDNLKLIRQRGFRGELIARMTIDEETRLDEAVKWLISNEELPFTSIHWQLDAEFWRRDFNSDRVEKWFRRYNDEVNNLVSYWIEHMEKTGHVLKIYPFIGLTESLLREEKTKLRCGAGWIVFNIQTDGNITPCPVMAGMKEFYLGNIRESAPEDLADSVSVKNLCSECTILDVCGGRCLYANATMLWGKEGHKAVCRTVSNLVESLQHSMPKIRFMIRRGELELQDFEHMKYNSCEIIP